MRVWGGRLVEMCGVAIIEQQPQSLRWVGGSVGVEEMVGEELWGWVEGRASEKEEEGVLAPFTIHLSKLVLISVTQLA